MTRRRIVLVAALVLVGGAAAFYALRAREPVGFRDVAWGATEKILRERVPISGCYPADVGVDYGTLRCRADSAVTIGDVKPTALWFYLRDNELIGWRLAYSSNDRATMIGAIIKRYGEPTEYDTKQATWKGRRAVVQLAMDPYNDVVLVVTTAELAALEVPKRDAVPKAAKGL